MRLAALILALALSGLRPQAIDGLGDLNRLGYVIRIEGNAYQFEHVTYPCSGALALDWHVAILICSGLTVPDEGRTQEILRKQVCFRALCNSDHYQLPGYYLWIIKADTGILAAIKGGP